MPTKGTALNTAAAASGCGGNGDPLMNMFTVFGDCDRDGSIGADDVSLSIDPPPGGLVIPLLPHG